MLKTEELLLEKRRYSLEEKITKDELEMLEKGFPIQKIIGYIEMANVKILINEDVLIPRYETEELINLALEKIKPNSKILDIGTGSGFIAVALAKNLPDSKVHAIDIDINAIKQTHQNIKENNLSNVEAYFSDIFSNVEEKFDVIISNPPYLTESEIIDVNMVQFEPKRSLIAGDDGLSIYVKILRSIEHFMKENAYVFFEINPRHENFFKYFGFELVKDINKKVRFAWRQF